MNPAAIVALIASVISVATSAIKLGADAAPFAQAIWDHLVNKKVVTEADGAALEARIAELSAQLQASLPPEQPDDV